MITLAAPAPLSNTIAPIKSPVQYIREEVMDQLDLWERIRAAIGGEDEVKKLQERILPRPNPLDTSDANRLRYQAYVTRAVWYNVSGRTLSGLTGYVFAKKPVVKLPNLLASLEKNVDGSGVTLDQQAKEALRLVLALGRCGLLVDYPSTTEVTSRQKLLDGNVAPTICLYQPEAIINWRVEYIGSRSFLSLLVLKERHQSPAENGFGIVVTDQYRVLRRTDAGVTGEVWRQDDASKQFVVKETYQPRNTAGQPLKIIPFTFLGAANNDAAVDPSPIADLVSLNLAHFRNSADYEEACYITGQPTPWASGLTADWVKEVLGGAIHLGSRAVIPLPVGGTAGLLQVAPNILPHEAMVHKEAQMVALGAKLVEQKEVQQTATEAGLNHISEVSTLTAAANNIFLGYKIALGFCGEFVGNAASEIEFELTEPLTKDAFSSEQATALMALWQGGLIDFEEARSSLKKSGMAFKDNNEVQANAEADTLRLPPPPPIDPNKPDPNAKPPVKE